MNSPISDIRIDGRRFLVKRDDLIDPYLAGNKYRKLYTLLQTPPQNIETIISYGGTQSNAMLAIAAMCKNKGWKFIYYTKPLSEEQKNENIGNFYMSKELGMLHVELQHDVYKEFIASLRLNFDPKTFIIDQGGATKEAKEGLEVLAKEIREADTGARSLATPSGTGTTALFLALALPEYRVYTTPCVGDVQYLREQMSALHEIPQNLVILNPDKKYAFAKPYKEFIEIWQKLQNGGVEFDLVYAPGMWKALLEQTDEEILYIHSGGVSGNESMLNRYNKKGYLR